jgi:hypothetical protein
VSLGFRWNLGGSVPSSDQVRALLWELDSTAAATSALSASIAAARSQARAAATMATAATAAGAGTVTLGTNTTAALAVANNASPTRVLQTMVIGGKTTNINDGHDAATTTTTVATVSSPTNATQSSPKAAAAGAGTMNVNDDDDHDAPSAPDALLMAEIAELLGRPRDHKIALEITPPPQPDLPTIKHHIEDIVPSPVSARTYAPIVPESPLPPPPASHEPPFSPAFMASLKVNQSSSTTAGSNGAANTSMITGSGGGVASSRDVSGWADDRSSARASYGTSLGGSGDHKETFQSPLSVVSYSQGGSRRRPGALTAPLAPLSPLSPSPRSSSVNALRRDHHDSKEFDEHNNGVGYSFTNLSPLKRNSITNTNNNSAGVAVSSSSPLATQTPRWSSSVVPHHNDRRSSSVIGTRSPLPATATATGATRDRRGEDRREPWIAETSTSSASFQHASSMQDITYGWPSHPSAAHVGGSLVPKALRATQSVPDLRMNGAPVQRSTSANASHHKQQRSPTKLAAIIPTPSITNDGPRQARALGARRPGGKQFQRMLMRHIQTHNSGMGGGTTHNGSMTPTLMRPSPLIEPLHQSLTPH